ncbi:MAG: ACP phosphodiesterase [Bacteroidia bacterium]|jgi:acyl carrier protein phosphodiesterase|nr:ACP phosphodiesterase [Bacteroidia bacterium]GIV22357.1 MAG: hypothetical protein KatS3mg025_0016 [Bacteroidia bacterium]
MHHLGHIYLAEGPPAFQFGAFIADGIRNPQLAQLPPLMQLGVRFHRWVDWQTDRHPSFLVARRLLRPVAGRYAGLIVDLWLDAALGQAWERHAPEPLETFAARFQKETLEPHWRWLPLSWHTFAEALKKEHLLLSFGSYAGMLEHIARFIRRRQLPLDFVQIQQTLLVQQQALEELLQGFWQEAQEWRHTADSFARIA